MEVPPAFREAGRDSSARRLFAPDTGGGAAARRDLAAPARVSNRAWRELGDTTLTRLVDQALGANLDIRAAEARSAAPAPRRPGPRSIFAPTVTFGGGYTRQRLSSAIFPIGASSFPDQDIWDAGFDASWELDLFGRVRRSVQAQGALVQLAREDLRDVQVSLVAEVARSYFDLRGAQEQLGVAQRNADNQRNTLELTRQRLDAGQGTAFDTERAQAQLSLTLASIPTLEARVAAAESQIGVLSGPPAGVGGRRAGRARGPAGLSRLGVGREPGLAGAPPARRGRRRAAGGGAARVVGSAKADYLPRVTVGGSCPASRRRRSNGGQPGTFRYAGGPVISWPLLNLGRVKARVTPARPARLKRRRSTARRCSSRCRTWRRGCGATGRRARG